MSGPVERWTNAIGLSGTEAKAAKIFSQVSPPAELSPQAQARHLAVLRGEVRISRRFRLSTPAAIAVLFGGSMAFAAARPEARAWVRDRMEAIGVLQPAPRKSAAVRPAAAVVIAPLPVVEEEAVTLEKMDVPVAEVPAVPVPAVRPVVRLAVRPSAPAGVKAAAVSLPSATPVAQAEVAPAPATPNGPAPVGVLDTPDIPDMSKMSTPRKIEIYLQRGDLDEAEELTESMAGDFSDKMTLLRGELLHARQRCKEANVYFTGVINTPGVPDALLERALWGRAVCHASLGDGAASHADIDRHVGKFPNGRFKVADEKLHRR